MSFSIGSVVTARRLVAATQQPAQRFLSRGKDMVSGSLFVQNAPLPPVSPIYPMKVDLVLSQTENRHLGNALLDVQGNPYKDYKTFQASVRDINESGVVPVRLADVFSRFSEGDQFENPYFMLKNCPIDPVIPLFGNTDPVNEKYRVKTTFVAEAFLQLAADRLGHFPIRYTNVNTGDAFQDIFPKEDLSLSQSQKSKVAIGFHKDLANHFVRPDHVNILALRNPRQNDVYTTFVRNKDILNNLPSEIVNVLRQPIFHTPFDDLTKYGDVDNKLGKPEQHPVIDGNELRYFEGRTTAEDPTAMAAITVLDTFLNTRKTRTFLEVGDFISTNNNTSIHGKDSFIRDKEAANGRWLMKTVNVLDPKKYEQHFVPGDYGLVKG